MWIYERGRTGQEVGKGKEEGEMVVGGDPSECAWDSADEGWVVGVCGRGGRVLFLFVKTSAITDLRVREGWSVC